MHAPQHTVAVVSSLSYYTFCLSPCCELCSLQAHRFVALGWAASKCHAHLQQIISSLTSVTLRSTLLTAP